MVKRGASKRSRESDDGAEEAGASKQPEAAGAAAAGAEGEKEGPPDHHTSKDYYFDSYGALRRPDCQVKGWRRGVAGERQPAC